MFSYDKTSRVAIPTHLDDPDYTFSFRPYKPIRDYVKSAYQNRMLYHPTITIDNFPNLRLRNP